MEQKEFLASEREKICMVQTHRFDAQGFRRDLGLLKHLVVERDRGAAVAQLQAMAERY